MAFRFEPRLETPAILLCLTPLLAVVLTLASGAVLFVLLGVDPLAAFHAWFITPLETRRGWGELAVKATPLTLCAIGLAIGFRANIWNIGAEGQLTIGALCGSGLALAFWGEEGPWLLPAMLLAGALGGLLWAAIPAFLKARANTSEILVSLMLTYVAQQILGYLIHGPWRDPEGFNFPESRLFGALAQLPILWSDTRLHLGALLALLAVLIAWWWLSRSFLSFQLTVIGQAPAAARYAGFHPERAAWMTLPLSGALAGLAGVCEVAGPIGQLTPSISPGYGFTAIIVAFLGRLHPLGVLLAALLMALFYLGGEVAQITLGLPQAITGVFQGMLLFYLLACDVLLRYRVRWRGPESGATAS